ncbi:tetratricopeptide repeat protein [Cryptosporangium sp. NPDC048952]|uniref:tetratricopeptide repeat protein n=1 Tax=Cryptosporangium sp. NPDC048952 TaxID=3363961 RepID=UPI00372103DC
MEFAEEVRAAFRRGDSAGVTVLARAEVERARAAGDSGGEVEALYALSRVALREDDLPRAEELAQAALAAAMGERVLEERPRHVLAAVARLSGNYLLARERYLASIALNEELGRPDVVTSESYNLAVTELHLGNLQRARELFAEVGERGFEARYLSMAGVAMASADGDHALAARLLGRTDAEFAAVGQVPDPDDARDLSAARDLAVAALGEERFTAEYQVGAPS